MAQGIEGRLDSAVSRRRLVKSHEVAVSVSEDVSRMTGRDGEGRYVVARMRDGGIRGKNVAKRIFDRGKGKSDRKGTMAVHHNFTFHELLLLPLHRAGSIIPAAASAARLRHDFHGS